MLHAPEAKIDFNELGALSGDASLTKELILHFRENKISINCTYDPKAKEQLTGFFNKEVTRPSDTLYKDTLAVIGAACPEFSTPLANGGQVMQEQEKPGS